MTPLFTFIILVTAFVAGYFFRIHAFEKAPSFSEQGAQKGRESIALRTQKRKARIMERAHAEGRVTNDDVEDLLLVSNNTALKYLNELEEEGKLEQKGTTGRGVYYIPKP